MGIAGNFPAIPRVPNAGSAHSRGSDYAVRSEKVGLGVIGLWQAGSSTPSWKGPDMVWKVIGGLLALWLAVTVLGFVVKWLFWLAVVGLVLIGGTVVVGWVSSAYRKQVKQ